MGTVPADGRLSHPDIDEIRVILGDGDGADGSHPEKTVGDTLPVETAVIGLPDASARGAEIVGIWLAGNSGPGRRPAAAEGADGAPFHGFVEARVENRGPAF